jgi:hypothetical protein
VVKYGKLIFCILLITALFSGCSFRFASSINDLISPISPFGENANIQTAMDTYVKNGYSLKNPSGGSYKTSYNFFDIDNDGVEEAVSFYEPKDNLGTIDMAVLKKVNDNWQVVENIVGNGKDVYSVDFCDVNGDSKSEILVCWDVISNSTNHVLSVYRCYEADGEFKVTSLSESITINNYICVDFDNDDAVELLLFKISSGNSSSAKAELYNLESNKFKLLGETKLDSHITSYTNLQVEKAENDVRVYADAVGSDGESTLTEIIYWSDTYNTIVSPFYSYSTGLTSETSRDTIITSIDVNDDSLIEIPLVISKKLPSGIKAIDWEIYKNTTLIHTNYSLFAENDGYTVVLPDEYFDNISVSYDEDSKELTVSNKKTKQFVFSIRPILKAVYNDKDFSDYNIILENSGYYYLAKCGNDSEIKISVDNLKGYIKSC